jgi:hypothetical protein
MGLRPRALRSCSRAALARVAIPDSRRAAVRGPQGHQGRLPRGMPDPPEEMACWLWSLLPGCSPTCPGPCCSTQGAPHPALVPALQRARKVHPDASDSQADQGEFTALVAAYELLSDPDARRAYDAQQHLQGQQQRDMPDWLRAAAARRSRWVAGELQPPCCCTAAAVADRRQRRPPRPQHLSAQQRRRRQGWQRCGWRLLGGRCSSGLAVALGHGGLGAQRRIAAAAAAAAGAGAKAAGAKAAGAKAGAGAAAAAGQGRAAAPAAWQPGPSSQRRPHGPPGPGQGR